MLHLARFWRDCGHKLRLARACICVCKKSILEFLCYTYRCHIAFEMINLLLRRDRRSVVFVSFPLFARRVESNEVGSFIAVAHNSISVLVAGDGDGRRRR